MMLMFAGEILVLGLLVQTKNIISGPEEWKTAGNEILGVKMYSKHMLFCTLTWQRLNLIMVTLSKRVQ